ncbi:Pfam:C4dic mal tran, partial [Geosmithia morbida]
MPLHNLGSLILHQFVFVIHLVYVNIAFAHIDPSTLVPLYCVSRLFARRGEDFFLDDTAAAPTGAGAGVGAGGAAAAAGANPPSSAFTPVITPFPTRPPTPTRQNGVQSAGYESPMHEGQVDYFSSSDLASPQPRNRGHQPQQQEDGRGGRQYRSNSNNRDAAAAVAATPPRPGPTRRVTNVNHASQILVDNGTNLDGLVSRIGKMGAADKVSLKDRIACYQWTYFTMTMATGGIANCIRSCMYPSHPSNIFLNEGGESNFTPRSVPSQPDWLVGVGLFFFLLNICLFLMNCALISMRFYLRPGSFTNSFTDQIESLFTPAFLPSMGTILIGICSYGIPSAGPWLSKTMEVMFWLIASTRQSSTDDVSLNYTAVFFCAVTTQGTGCLIAFMISAAFLYRLMTQKLPRDMQRPGVFMAIGPYGFTAAGLLQIGNEADIITFPDALDPTHAIQIVRVVSLLVSLWMWGLSMWFFLVSVGSLWKYTRPGHHLPFQMTWWSFVFPNTALVTATEAMGKVFDSHGIRVFGIVMTVALVVVWILSAPGTAGIDTDNNV